MEKKENCTLKRQNTNMEALNGSNVSELSLAESQDFHLVDMSEDESQNKLQLDLEDSKEEHEPSSVTDDNKGEILNEISIQKAIPDTQNDNLSKEGESQSEETEEEKETNESSITESKEKQTEEEEEVIQCTPPEAVSPSKKQGGGTITSLKRQLELFDGPPKKILRTMSKEDVSMFENRQQEEQSSHSDDSQRELLKNCSEPNIIIAETQDVEDGQEMQPTLEKPDKYEEKGKGDSGNKNAENVRLIEIKNTKINNEKVEDKENDIEPNRHMQQNSSDIQKIPLSKEMNVCDSRKSIEVIYDQTTIHDDKPKLKVLVEIDEDGEKIVLDSSQEDFNVNIPILDNTKSETIYKSCYESKSNSDFSYKSIESTKESSLDSTKSGSKLVNGSSESKKCDTDSTTSLQSDTFSDMPVLDKADSNISTSVHNINRQIKPALGSKDSDHTDLLSVSDNEPDVVTVDDKSKSNSTHSSSISKAFQMEKEIGIYVRMKCLLQVDDSTKEFLSKEITAVQCEAVDTEPTLRQKNNDTSASLADISGNDNKDASPGSVNSNPQLYQLNPSRLSFASTVNSLSSVSSAASLAAKHAMRDSTHFSLPRAPAKHAKRHAQDINLFHDKQSVDEAYERLSKEWQNNHLLTTTILNFANTELTGTDSYNVSNERIDDQLQKIRSSTPEVPQEMVLVKTPKSTKKNKAVVKSRSKSTKSEGRSNELNKISKVLNPMESNSALRKKNKTEHVDSTPATVVVSTNLLTQIITDELIGKVVFAKWSDNNYYPGMVVERIKLKYKVNFYDEKSKVLIEDFIIPIPKVLKEGLSVYAATKKCDYDSHGIITETETVNNEVYYTVETDEGERLRVQIKDISLSPDQAQVLKEEINADNKSLLSTPKHLDQVTLDNMVDGKRRSKRIVSPIFSTPKIKLFQTPTNKSIVEPSVSGVSSTIKQKKACTESDIVSSDSNVSLKEEIFPIGVQPEIIGTPYEQIVKGPQNRIKSKSRSKKKVEDEETIAMFGPIPQANSNLFKGMSFILTCASLETIDRFQDDTKDYGSDLSTENEEEWVKKPFVRDRLNKQIIAGGGKVYTDFNEIPQEEYRNTKLITNVPNTTAKTLQCLSVGIPAYNHNWIIRCCQEGKIVNPAENELPVGWSLDKNSYMEMFQRSNSKPLAQVVVIIPVLDSEKQFATFWRQICENAGAVVLIADKPDTMEGFEEGSVVLSNSLCPSWAVEKANELQIPLLSTTWIIQCLIEGKLCRYDGHSRYKYNYKNN